MANVKWQKLQRGDFFTADIGQGLFLYQKIKREGVSYNAILLNTGEICNLYIDPMTTFEKVEVTFDIKPTE